MFVRLALSHLTSRLALFALFSAALPSPPVKRVDYLITPWGRYAQNFFLISPTLFDLCALFVTRITSELRDTGHRRLNKQIHLNRTSL